MNENKKKDELWHSDANSYGELIRNIGSLLETGKKQAVSAVNQAMVRTYWEIGKHIVEYEQAGNEKAEYGSETLKRLSRDLTERYGNGFGMSNINKMRKFYSLYPILQTVSTKTLDKRIIHHYSFPPGVTFRHFLGSLAFPSASPHRASGGNV